MADEMDKIKQKLKLDRLDDVNKKELFNKFTEAGGQVVDLNKRKGPTEHKSTKPGTKVKDVETVATVKSQNIRQMRLEEERRRKMEQKAAESLSKSSSASAGSDDNPVNKWIESFSAKLTGTFSGIFNLRASRFKRKFADLILEKYQNALLESQMVLASVLHQNEMVRDEIKKRLSVDQSVSYLYELMYRYDSVYEQPLFQKIGSLNADLKQVNDMRSEFIKLFKPLYILKSYSTALKNAVERALLFEKELRRLDSNTAFANYRKVNNNIDFIYQKVYPKLFSLVDFYYKEESRKRNVYFREFIGVSEEDEIGFFTTKWREEQEYFAQKERIQNEVKGGSSPTGENTSEVQEGHSGEESVFNRAMKHLKSTINFKQILANYRTKKDLRALFAINDKVFLTYALIDFFDKEYSSLFTSSKVGYNVSFSFGSRFDIKKDLSDTYYKINNLVYERVNEYLKVIREIKKAETDTYMSIDEKSNRMNQFSVQRSQISRTLRKEARGLFEKFSKSLLLVVNDYEGSKNILQNPEEVLGYNKKIDGVRLLDGKKVIDGIYEAYYLCYMIHFLLVEGDLGGYGVVLEKPIYVEI